MFLKKMLYICSYITSSSAKKQGRWVTTFCQKKKSY